MGDLRGSAGGCTNETDTNNINNSSGTKKGCSTYNTQPINL